MYASTDKMLLKTGVGALLHGLFHEKAFNMSIISVGSGLFV
jgi:hypothetical protein